MQGNNDEQKQKAFFKMQDLSIEEKSRLVGAFVWLLKEDKKQNPELYKPMQPQNAWYRLLADTERENDLPIRGI